MAIMKRLQDWWGQDAQIAEEVEQTERPPIGAIRQEFGEHPARGLTPAKLADILVGAEQRDIRRQSELAEDMEERDAHLFAEISKRKRALLSLEWTLDPPRNASAAEQTATDQTKELILSIPDLEDVFLDLGDAILKGFSCLEIDWRRIGNEWLPGSLALRPQRWFTLDERRENLTLRNNTAYGEPLWPLGWMTHIHRAKSGYIARGGLCRILAWPYLFKNYSVRDLAEFLEIAGGIRLGKYPVGAKPEEKSRLLAALVSIGHNAAGIIPESMAIELHEASKASADPYLAMIDWAERSQSKAILGQTLSAESKSTGLGSGVANLQADVRDDILKSDARQIAGTLTRDLVYPLLALNAGWQDPLRCPRFRFVIEETEDITAYAEALPKLVQIGMPIPVSWAQQRLGIPAPQDGEPVLQAATPVASPVAPAKATTPPWVAIGSAADGRDAIDDLVDEAIQDWQPQLAPVIDPVVTAAKDAADYDDFLRRLDLLSAQYDARLIVQKLAEATFKARGMGDATDAI